MPLRRLNAIQRKRVYARARARYAESLRLDLTDQQRVDWVVKAVTDDCRSIVAMILLTIVAKIAAELVWRWIKKKLDIEAIPEYMPEGFGDGPHDFADDE